MEKHKKQSNIIIGEDFIKYNALKLYNDDTEFRIPSYLVSDIVKNNKQLVLSHNNKTLKVYEMEALMDNLIKIDSKLYEGTFHNEPITFNITVFKI